MNTKTLQILDIIKSLPLSEKFSLVELIFKNIKEETIHHENRTKARQAAAELLLADYEEGEDLTVFTVLDTEDIYEVK